MEEKIRSIVWSKSAEIQLLKIFQYIVKDSYQNAVKVVDSIEVKVNSLLKIRNYIHRTNINL